MITDQDRRDIVLTLKEILKWIRIQATPAVKATMETILTKAEHRKLYDSLDGHKTQTQLAKASGISQPRISQLVAAWQKAGIVEEASSGKYVKSFNLEDLGMSISTLQEGK